MLNVSKQLQVLTLPSRETAQKQPSETTEQTSLYRHVTDRISRVTI